MPNYQDAYISDVIVNIDETPERPFDKVIEELKQAGLQVNDVQKEQCSLSGSIECSKVGVIDKLPGVDYVRTVFTYVADFPPGDPRDLDKVAREGD